MIIDFIEIFCGENPPPNNPLLWDIIKNPRGFTARIKKDKYNSGPFILIQNFDCLYLSRIDWCFDFHSESNPILSCGNVWKATRYNIHGKPTWAIDAQAGYSQLCVYSKSAQNKNIYHPHHWRAEFRIWTPYLTARNINNQFSNYQEFKNLVEITRTLSISILSGYQGPPILNPPINPDTRYYHAERLKNAIERGGDPIGETEKSFLSSLKSYISELETQTMPQTAEFGFRTHVLVTACEQMGQGGNYLITAYCTSDDPTNPSGTIQFKYYSKTAIQPNNEWTPAIIYASPQRVDFNISTPNRIPPPPPSKTTTSKS